MGSAGAGATLAADHQRWRGRHAGGLCGGGVDPEGHQARDVWQVLHHGAPVPGRLDRWVARLGEQQATVLRQAERLAAGQRARGRRPVSDLAAQAALVQQAVGLAEGLR